MLATRGGVGTTIATRGGCRTQHANSAQGAGRLRITTPSQNRKKGRGWHTNREGGRAILVSHLAISYRDPKRLAPRSRLEEGRRPQHTNSAQSIRQYNYVVDVDGGVMQTRTGLGVDTLYLP